MTAVTQIQVVNGALVQTLVAEATPDGITLLSTFALASGPGDAELHIPAAACAWLARVAGRMVR